MQELAVLLERLAVVGKEDDERVLLEPLRLERVEKRRHDTVVHPADDGVVEIRDVTHVTRIARVDRRPEPLVRLRPERPRPS